MIAYHGDPKQKTKILAQLRRHAKADQLVKGQYWEAGKGCAVGCTIYSGNHAEYEPRFGIPRELAHLEDRIFERLDNGDSQKWPIRFMSAIKPGADLSGVWPDFAVWLLTDPAAGVLRFAKADRTRKSIQAVADLYTQRVWKGDARWSTARTEARAACLTLLAADAARSAAAAARSAADDAPSAAADAAYAADANAAAAAAAAARKRFWRTASDKLLTLLAAAPLARSAA